VRYLSEICGLHSVRNLTAYIGLFLVAFGAATVLPFQSEPVLSGLLVSGKFFVPGLILVASVGTFWGQCATGFLAGSLIAFRTGLGFR
jgi:membrane protein YqaA with SNARE-associated domain